MSSISVRAWLARRYGESSSSCGLLQPAQDPGQRAVAGDPVVVEGQVLCRGEPQERGPLVPMDGVVAVVGDANDIDDPGLVQLSEAFADVALGEAGGGVDDSAGQPRRSDRQ